MQLLSQRSCVFQYGVVGRGRPARLNRDGWASFGQLHWADDEGFPANTDVELLTEASPRAGGESHRSLAG
jgi:hypothetical protein